jgi:ribosome maturation factor RimP
VWEWVDARSFLRAQRATIQAFDHITRLIEPTLRTMGFEVVIVRMHGGQRPRLQVMAEPVDRDRAMTVDDCAEISHAVSAILDVNDPIPGAYTLEVSSPGVDRPLARPEHFERFTGERARFETETLLDGRRRFVGRLAGVEDGRVLMEVEEPGGAVNLVRLPLSELKRAKLVMADEVVAPAPRAAGRGMKRKGKKDHGA